MAPHRRITVDFAPFVLEKVDRASWELSTSRNRFITKAVERALREEERNRMDAAFSRMSEDPAYQKLLSNVESDLAGASDAAWRMIDAAETSRDVPPRKTRAGRRRAAR